jgi:hypothetical protein
MLTIKDTITAIFDLSLEKLPDTTPEKKLRISCTKRVKIAIYYSIFLELISNQDESSFDILCWVIETFFQIENKHSKGSSFRTSVSQLPQSSIESSITASDALQDFANSLINHFAAPQSLVRFGASLALLSIIKLCPSFPLMNRPIWPFIISGVLDSDVLTSGIYLKIVQTIKIPESNQIKEMIARSRMNTSKKINYDELNLPEYSEMVNTLNKSELLDIVVKHSPPISITVLHKMATTLDFISPSAKLVQLELIRIWGRKSNKVCSKIIPA